MSEISNLVLFSSPHCPHVCSMLSFRIFNAIISQCAFEQMAWVVAGMVWQLMGWNLPIQGTVFLWERYINVAFPCLKWAFKGWGDASVLKGTGYSSWGFPLSIWWLTAISDLSSKGSEAFFWPSWVPSMGVVHRGTHRQNNHTHTVKRNFKITKVSNRLYPILLHSMISYK